MKRNYAYKQIKIMSFSSAMDKVFETLIMAENQANPVLIEGEDGTEKEFLSAVIHYSSPRKKNVFISQNCAMLRGVPLSVALFGHANYATDCVMLNKKGLLELADGGTLFLDRIETLEYTVQEKLLQVLNFGTFCSVGGIKEKKIDVRLITSTSKELEDLVKIGLFMEDLYFKINSIHITIPPLRTRKNDILPLANHFVETYAQIHNTARKELSKEVISRLKECEWYGNIVELKSFIKSLIAISGQERVINQEHFQKVKFLGREQCEQSKLSVNTKREK